jgi:hypothetical protein
MRTSETTAALDAALAAAQGEIKDPAKTKWNPHFKKHYADVQDGLEAARPVLAKHGISLVQATSIVDGFVIVTSRISHKGEWIEGVYPVGSVTVPQQTLMGNLTYARRAGFFGLVGIAPDDMDGEDAPAAEPAKAQYGHGTQQQRATSRSTEKAAEAPIVDPAAAGDYRDPTGDVPHDPETGEIPGTVELLEPSASEAVKDEMVSKLEKIGKGTFDRKTLSVWSKQNKPYKERLQPEHKKDVELVFKALTAAVKLAEQNAAAQEDMARG